MSPCSRRTEISAAILAAALALAFFAGCPEHQDKRMARSKKQDNTHGTSQRPPDARPASSRPAPNLADPGAATATQQALGAGRYEKATFAAGCFWGVEASFRAVEGVVATEVGYTGGHTQNPTYSQVCSDKTGHAEAVQVIYDPNLVSYEQLLALFWKIHDPTTLNRQGRDVGTQYRSAIFYHSPRQQALAQKSMEELARTGRFKKPIVTQIVPATQFYRAEEYHQRYLEKKGIKVCPSTAPH